MRIHIHAILVRLYSYSIQQNAALEEDSDEHLRNSRLGGSSKSIPIGGAIGAALFWAGPMGQDWCRNLDSTKPPRGQSFHSTNTRYMMVCLTKSCPPKFFVKVLLDG